MAAQGRPRSAGDDEGSASGDCEGALEVSPDR
jgi:hypothetical protein